MQQPFHQIRITGLISRPAGSGSHSSSSTSATAGGSSHRQFFYLNKRPWDIPLRLSRAFNDGFRTFHTNNLSTASSLVDNGSETSSAAGTPFVLAHFHVPPTWIDVNLSPDKRTLWFSSPASAMAGAEGVRSAETAVADSLRVALEDFYRPWRGMFSVTAANAPHPVGPSDDGRPRTEINDHDTMEMQQQEEQDGTSDQGEKKRQNDDSSPSYLAKSVASGSTRTLRQTRLPFDPAGSRTRSCHARSVSASSSAVEEPGGTASVSGAQDRNQQAVQITSDDDDNDQDHDDVSIPRYDQMNRTGADQSCGLPISNTEKNHHPRHSVTVGPPQTSEQGLITPVPSAEAAYSSFAHVGLKKRLRDTLGTPHLVSKGQENSEDGQQEQDEEGSDTDVPIAPMAHTKRRRLDRDDGTPLELEGSDARESSSEADEEMADALVAEHEERREDPISTRHASATGEAGDDAEDEDATTEPERNLARLDVHEDDDAAGPLRTTTAVDAGARWSLRKDGKDDAQVDVIKTIDTAQSAGRVRVHLSEIRALSALQAYAKKQAMERHRHVSSRRVVSVTQPATDELELDTNANIEKDQRQVDADASSAIESRALRARVRSQAKVDAAEKAQAGFQQQDAAIAEGQLSRTIHQVDFLEHMHVVGQFNLAFLIARRTVPTAADGTRPEWEEEDDLFIIDQHAADEKYNFEMLQREEKMQSQPLIV